MQPAGHPRQVFAPGLRVNAGLFLDASLQYAEFAAESAGLVATTRAQMRSGRGWEVVTAKQDPGFDPFETLHS